VQLIKDLLSRNKVLSVLVGAVLIRSLAIKNLLKETKEALKGYLRAKLQAIKEPRTIEEESNTKPDIDS
jgi:hypothetical protein